MQTEPFFFVCVERPEAYLGLPFVLKKLNSNTVFFLFIKFSESFFIEKLELTNSACLNP